MYKIKKSHGCCAIYELFDLVDLSKYNPSTGNVLMAWRADKKEWDKVVADVLGKAYRSGGGRYPVLIVFSDASFDQTPPRSGNAWYKALKARNHKVTRTALGRNPKSGNCVTLYHWYPAGN